MSEAEDPTLAAAAAADAVDAAVGAAAPAPAPALCELVGKKSKSPKTPAKTTPRRQCRFPGCKFYFW